MQIVLALCSAFLTLGSFREIILEGMKADLHSPGAPPDRPALLLPPCSGQLNTTWFITPASRAAR